MLEKLRNWNSALVRLSLIVQLAAYSYAPQAVFAQDADSSPPTPLEADTVPTLTQADLAILHQLAELDETYSSLLAAQQDLSPLETSEAVQVDHLLGLPNAGCFVVAQLDEQQTLPIGMSNITVVSTDTENAASGNVYYRQTEGGNAQLALSPNASHAGVLFYSYSVDNQSPLPEPVLKIETHNNSDEQVAPRLVSVARESGWQTYVGTLAAKAGTPWILTLATDDAALPLGGELRFDAVQVISCATELTYLPVVGNEGARCAAGQYGVVIRPGQSVEDVANQNLIAPSQITVTEASNGQQLACWGKVQTTAYKEGEELDFFGVDRSFYSATLVGALARPVSTTPLPWWVESVIGKTNTPASTFSGEYVGKLLGPSAILGMALSEGVAGYAGYLENREQSRLLPFFTPEGPMGNTTLVHQEYVDPGELETVYVYNLNDYPNDTDALGKVVAHTCVAYCDSETQRSGWVFTQDYEPDATYLDIAYYPLYRQVLATLIRRFDISSEYAQQVVSEAQKERVTEHFEDFFDEEPDNVPDDVFPPLPPIGVEGDDDDASECHFPVVGLQDELPADYDPTPTILSDIGRKVIHDYDVDLEPESSAWERLLKSMTDNKIRVSVEDISYERQGPPWQLGTEARVAIPDIGISLVYTCSPPEFPDIMPFAEWVLTRIENHTNKFPWNK